MVAQEKIAEAAKILLDAARPRKIILFGSYGRGEPAGDSDVDLLVVEADVKDRVAEMTSCRVASGSGERKKCLIRVIDRSIFRPLNEP